MKRLLITGAGKRSFIGRSLAEALHNEYEILAPTRSELDLRDELKVNEYFKTNPVDIVIHCAIHVPMHHGAEHEADSDLRMFFSLENCSEYYNKLIYFGSGAEYDKRYDVCQVKEDEIGRSLPTTEYGLAKYVMNKYARLSANIYNLRLFGVFGPYEGYTVKFISGLCCKAIMGLPLTIRQNCYFDFMYIDDLVNIVRWAIEETPRFKDYNLCTGIRMDLVSIAKIVYRISKKNLKIEVLNKDMNKEYTGNNHRLMSELKGYRLIPLEEAVELLYNYYLNHVDDICIDSLVKNV